MIAWLTSLPDRLAAVLAPHLGAVRVGCAALLVVLLTVTAVRYLKKVDKPSDVGTYTRSAFLRWKPQVEALDRGEDIYDRYQYPNPPIMALILRPVMLVPSPADAMVWLLVKAVLAAVSFVWVFRLVESPHTPLPALAKWAAIWLPLHPVLGDLSHGNVNIFIAFLVFAALELFRRRLDLLSGVVLALAIACKVTPALFVPYFGWKALLGGWTTRSWSGLWRGGGAVLAGCAVGLILWLFVVPGAALGFGRNVELLHSWYGQMVRPFVVEGKVTSEHPNQSIPGVVFRLLTHSESDTVYDDDGKPIPSEYRNVADIGPAGARWVIRGCQAAFVLAIVLLCRARVWEVRQGLAVAAECGLIVLGMLMFSERTWKHQATTLMLPVAVLVGCWATRPLSVAARGFLMAVLGLTFLLVLLPSVASGDFQDDCLTYGTHTAAFLLLTAGVCAVLGWEKNSSPRPAGAS